MPSVDETRASLIARLPDSGDAEAWEKFESLYSPVVFRVARSHGIQPVDADNLVQEVLLSVSQSIEAWLGREDRGRFRPWLLRVAKNASIDLISQRTQRPIGIGGDSNDRRVAAIADRRSLDSAFDVEYQQALFHEAARALKQHFPKLHWEAFWLTRVEGVSVQECADRLGMTTGNVYVARSRVMSALRRRVEQESFLDAQEPTP